MGIDRPVNSWLEKPSIHSIQYAIAYVDDLIQQQLTAVLHHPRFQKLEASWRGLYYLAGQMAENDNAHLKLKVLCVSWEELAKDSARAIEFDQSQLFAKIYSQEFGQPGGEPFGLLVGDYYFSHRTTQRVSPITLLQEIAKVAAAAFAPFITAAAPDLLGVDDFAELERHFNLERTFQQVEYANWKLLRQNEDTRFVGLVLPQVLMRLPYQEQNAICYPFCFTEPTANRQDFLWGNAAYCFATIVIRAFSQTGWFTAIRGKSHFDEDGMVSRLPQPYFTTDSSLLAAKLPINVYITDKQEKNISDFGLIALTHCALSRSIAFYECSSLQKSKVYMKDRITQNAKLSTMLHHILCVSRFAHYLKMITRDKIGIFNTPQECERYLQDWLHQYTAATSDLSNDLKTKYPLRSANVQVYESPGSPGKYACTIHLSPHYQFDQIESHLQFKTELIRNL
jgi:type VI secretion system protein ImpD